MIKLNLVCNSQTLGEIFSPVVPRENETVAFDNELYKVVRVFYHTSGSPIINFVTLFLGPIQ